MAWLASHTLGKSDHDALVLSGYVDDQAAEASADSKFEAVDELCEMLSMKPDVAFHQLVSA